MLKTGLLLSSIRKALFDSAEILSQFAQHQTILEKIEQISFLMAECFEAGNKILICGNGGSACDAMHFAEEFTGRYRHHRKPLPVIALTDPSHITCVGNDYGFEEIFARGVEAYGKKGDILIVLSTSGNSKNVIRAVEKAKELKLTPITFLGKDGGSLKGSCDMEFIIPARTSDRIQEVHMTLLHVLIEGVERILFPENYQQEVMT